MKTQGKNEVIKTLFENPGVVVVDKPAGIFVAPADYGGRADTLLGFAQDYFGQKLWVVHRINKDATGVVLFAKNADAYSNLTAQFENNEMSLKHLAVVNGRINEDGGEITAPISVRGQKVSIRPEGKKSLTKFKVLEKFRDYTFAEAEPLTNRKHQIRIHFFSIGHPLAADTEYSGKGEVFLSEFKKKYKPGGVEKPLLARLSLHAASISFCDPQTGERIDVRSPLPDDFELALKQLRKYDAF